MIQEYVVRITGDTSGLKKAIKESKGDLKSIGDNEYIIKIGYDGNPKELNKKLQEIAKSSPELAIQFQYNVNQKALNQELDKLKNLQELKLDIETDGANKKITGMISELAKAVKTDTSEDIIESKIKGIYKYANTISELGGKISQDLSGGIYNAISGTKFEVIFDKLLEKTDTSKLRLFNFKKPLDDEIIATEQRISEFKNYLDDLEKRGASKGGMSSELQQLQDEVKILRSDLSDMKKELGSISGEQFNKLADDIKDVNAQLQIALDKIATLSGENSLGNVIQKWQKDDITKTRERYTAFNSKNMQTSGEHVAASASGVSEELIRKSIKEMAGEADGFIHSHPEKYAAFSDNDIVSYFKLFNEGITKQILASYNQVLSLDMSAINTDYQDEIIQRIKQRFSEIEDIEVYEKNIFQYIDSLKQALQDGLSSDVAKLLPTDVINTFKKKYGDFLSSVGEDFTADDLFNGIDQVVADTLKESSSYISGSNELKKNIRQNLIGITPHLLGIVNDYLHDQQQLMFQEELMSVFSNPKYLRDGIESAIKLQDVDDFVKDAQEAGGKIGRGIVESFREGIDAHSNSKEAERAVDDFANGVVDEFEKRTDDMVQAAKKAGDAVTESFNNSLKDSFDELDEVYAREAESRDSMQGYDTPLYSEADIDRIYSRHDDVILGYQHDIDDLQDELRDAEDDNRDLREENRELKEKLSNSKSLSPIEQFYKDYGTPSRAMDIGYSVDDVLRMLGGKFAEMDVDDVRDHEWNLNLEFFKELLKYAELTEDELDVVKAAMIEIEQYGEGGKYRHLIGNEFTANEIVGDRLKLLDQIFKKEHEIAEWEKSNAKIILKYESENKSERASEESVEDNVISFDILKKKSKETTDELTTDLQQHGKQFEQLSEGIMRVLSEIGLSYDEYIEKINSQKRGMDWGERLATVVNDKIQESIKGTQMNVGWSDDVKIDNSIEKILHLHPNGKGQAEVFSSADILGYFDKVLSKGYNIPFELWQNGQKTMLDFGNMPSSVIPRAITALSQVEKIVSQNLKKNGGSIKSEFDDEYQQLTNSLFKAIMERYGGKFTTDKDINSKIDSQSLKTNLDILEEYVSYIRGEKDSQFHGEEDSSSFLFLKSLFKKIKNGEEVIDNDISPELQKFKEKYEKLKKEIEDLLQSDNIQDINDAGMKIAMLASMVNKNAGLDQRGHVARLDEVSALQDRQMDIELALLSGKENPYLHSSSSIQSTIDEITQAEDRMGNEAQEATEQAGQGLAEMREEAEKTKEAISDINEHYLTDDDGKKIKAFRGHVTSFNETPALFQEQAESIEQNQNDIQEEIRETVDEIDNLIEKEKEMSSTQLPAVIPLIDNQAQAREAFNKDVRSELFADGNAKQSGELIKYEAKALDVLDKNAEDAAESKNKFATANIVVLKSIIDSVAGLDNEGNAFKALNKLIGDFANADDESIRHIADNIKILRDALNEHIDDNSLLNALKELSQQGVNLKDLSSSIKNAKKQVESNGKNTIDPAKFETDIDDQIRKIDYLLDKGKYVEGFKEKLNALRTSLDSLSDAGASDESVKKLKEITKQISEFSRQATLAENKATNSKSISKLLGQINDILSKNTSAKFKRTNVYKDLIDYQTQLKSFDASRPKAEFDELADAVLKTVAEVKELDQATRGSGFLGRVSNRLADINAKFIAQYLSFHDLIRYARTAVTTIIDLDTQLVDLRKTTKMNDSELEEFYKNSANVAKQLGVTTSEIISQASAWSRLGFNTKEASTEMAKLSSQFASISPGMTTDEAQTGLVSVMKAWNVDVSRVSRDIMDNINTLGLYKAQTYSNVRCQIN